MAAHNRREEVVRFRFDSKERKVSSSCYWRRGFYRYWWKIRGLQQLHVEAAAPAPNRRSCNCLPQAVRPSLATMDSSCICTTRTEQKNRSDGDQPAEKPKQIAGRRNGQRWSRNQTKSVKFSWKFRRKGKEEDVSNFRNLSAQNRATNIEDHQLYSVNIG